MQTPLIRQLPFPIMLLLLGLMSSLQPVAAAETKPMMKYPLEMEIERKIVVDPVDGQKNLQFLVTITNTHYLIDTQDMELTLLVVGEYDGRPNALLKDMRSHKVLDRMLLNQKAQFSLPHLKTLNFKSKIIKSGQADPNHNNHGVWYQGFVAVIEDKNGHQVIYKCSEQQWIDRFKEIEKVSTGKDFKKRIIARLR